MQVRAIAAFSATGPLGPHTIERREVGEHDVLIAIAYAGICHSDIHTVRGEWDEPTFPMVPGHEIAGTVTAVGTEVTRFSVGDRVGVGCLVDSCRECANCRAGEEQYCMKGDSPDLQRHRPRRQDHLRRLQHAHRRRRELRVAHPGQDRPGRRRAAAVRRHHPLLPAATRGRGPGKKVAIVGMGGLGHIGVKIAHALGAEVSVLSQSLRRERTGCGSAPTTTTPPATRRLQNAGQHARPDCQHGLGRLESTLTWACWRRRRAGRRGCPRSPSRTPITADAERRMLPARRSAASARPRRCSTSAPSMASAPRSR